jgi:ribonuclease HI
MRFKDAEVLARCDAAGLPVSDGGRVEIRYRAQDGRAYHASVRNLMPLPGSEVLPDDACADAREAAAPRAAASGQRKPGSSKPRPAAAPAGPVPEGTVIAYTDGACSGNPGPAGVGVVLIDGKQRRELSEFLGTATNNIAELMGVALAVQAAPPDRPLRVHTDSQYSIGVLTKGWKAKANQELIAKLRVQLKEHGAVEIVYVPGHAGVLLNERADALAVQAVQARRSEPWKEY